MFDMNGKTVFLTGAAGGLGKAIAESFYAQGSKIILAGRNEEALNALKNELGERAFVVCGDLADPEVPAKILAEGEDKTGAPIDILINNAGLTRDGLAMRMKDEDWDMVINVNLSSAFRLMRSVLKGMTKRRAGRIINISSIVGTTGNPGQMNYAASKGGLVAATKSLAQEIASRGITVNCIAPGFIISPMTDKLTEDQKNTMLANIPVGYLGEGRDIAAACLYLASDEARYVTGQTIHVNGGMVMI